MAVLPQFGGLAEALMRDYGALLSAAGNNVDGYHQQYNNSASQRQRTCNGGGCGGVGLLSRKRGREVAMKRYMSSALLPVPAPGVLEDQVVVLMSPDPEAGRTVGPAMVESTSGRAAAADEALVVGVEELWRRQGAEVDALVRAECDRLRAGMMEHARKRQRHALARAVAIADAAEPRLREAGARLDAAQRRAAELEERVRHAAAETAAWRGVARGHEAAAAGLRAALDRVVFLRGCDAEGFGESTDVPAPSAAEDDALSRCFFEATDAATSSAGKRACCRACGEGEATVLVLPCRHLCLCKACEPRLDACPVCLAVKNASIHVAGN